MRRTLIAGAAGACLVAGWNLLDTQSTVSTLGGVLGMLLGLALAARAISG